MIHKWIRFYMTNLDTVPGDSYNCGRKLISCSLFDSIDFEIRFDFLSNSVCFLFKLDLFLST